MPKFDSMSFNPWECRKVKLGQIVEISTIEVNFFMYINVSNGMIFFMQFEINL